MADEDELHVRRDGDADGDESASTDGDIFGSATLGRRNRHLDKLSLRQRRNIIARQCLAAKTARRDAEARARKEGYASVAARERAKLIEAKREMWERKQFNWNKPQPFGQDGHRAYAQEREVTAHKTRESRDPAQYASLELMQAQDPEDVRRKCRERIRKEVEQDLAPRRFRQVGALRERLHRTQNLLREREAVRQEDFLARMFDLATLNPEILEADSSEGKYYRRKLEEDLELIREELSPRIAQAEIDLAQAVAGLEAEATAATQLEWQRQLAVRAYCRVCNETKSTVSRSVLASLRDGRLCIDKVFLSDEQIMACAAGMAQLDSVSAVELSENNLEGRAAAALRPVLETKSLANLQTLAIDNNALHADGAVAVLAALKTASFAERLANFSLRGNQIGQNDMRAHVELAKELQDCLCGGALSRLTRLDLGHNVLSARLGRALASAIQDASCSLEAVGVRFTDMGSPTLLRVLGAVAASSKVKELDIGFAGLGDAHAAQIARVLTSPKSSVRVLALDGSARLTDKGCGTLASALRINRSLAQLCIANCGYTIQGCRGLIEALHANCFLEELAFDLDKCLQNPLTKASPGLRPLLYLGLPVDAEFALEVVEVTSYAALEARLFGQGVVHGHSRLPRLTGPRPETATSYSISDCTVGMRCLAAVFEGSTGAPLLNVEVLEVHLNAHLQRAEPQVRVKLLDFVRVVEDGFEVYEPVKLCQGLGLDLKGEYPLVPLSKLQNSPADVAVLRLEAAPKSMVFFPLQLLPHWLQHPETWAFVRSGVVRNAQQPGAVLAELEDSPESNAALGEETSDRPADATRKPRVTSAHRRRDLVELHCPNLASNCPEQVAFAVQWPMQALRPRALPAYELQEDGRVRLPPVRLGREGGIASAPKEPLMSKDQGLAFEFYRRKNSSTASLRLLRKQSETEAA